ncbi:MAG: hypothetical protein H6600_02500 [Flavobacteriales bacterium]|nr:hypothetical protein [Flavobacteriales bacterium]
MTTFKNSDKVWIYTSPAKFTEEQKERILSASKEFLGGWESHGSKVKGDVIIAHDHFLMIIADDCDGDMCGRAKDAQVRFTKELGERLGLDLLDRMQIAYRDNTGDVIVKKLPEFKSEIIQGNIGKETVVFNNLIASFGEIESKWEVQLKDSWHVSLLKSCFFLKDRHS